MGDAMALKAFQIARHAYTTILVIDWIRLPACKTSSKETKLVNLLEFQGKSSRKLFIMCGGLHVPMHSK